MKKLTFDQWLEINEGDIYLEYVTTNPCDTSGVDYPNHLDSKYSEYLL